LERKTNNAQYTAINNTTQAMTCRGRGKKRFREAEEANIFLKQTEEENIKHSNSSFSVTVCSKVIVCAEILWDG
jgi:uncharacterized protein YllA (UPF0747 family)